MKRILFIDRDGTLIKESPPTYQIDDFSKLEFFPCVFEFHGKDSKGIGLRTSNGYKPGWVG